MGWDNVEKRQFARGNFPCKLFIHYPEGHIISAYTEDISRGGVRVVLEEKIEVSTIVDVEIYFEEEPIICKGKITWIKEKESVERKGVTLFDTGIECFKTEQENEKAI